jgi:hypothetical protein
VALSLPSRFSDHVIFCGATNDNSHMAGVSSILEPVKSRWDTIVELVPDHQEWVKWAISRGLPEQIIAFAMFRGPEAVFAFKATRDLTNSPTPRTITSAARLFAAGIRNHHVISGAAGEGWAAEFLAFAKVYQSIPNPEECLKNPDTAPVPAATDASTLYAIAVAISLRATEANFDKATRYLSRLPKEHEVLAVRDALMRWPSISRCWMSCMRAAWTACGAWPMSSMKQTVVSVASISLRSWP